ncbi:2-oxo acid dehydrogenase subunit E2 [Geodermatophilus sp. SYSU D01062]
MEPAGRRRRTATPSTCSWAASHAKPVVVGDRIEAREVLGLTVAFDHDVVDGAPAARFVERLVDHVESGAGPPGAPPGPPPVDTDRQAPRCPWPRTDEVVAPAPAGDGPAARRA